MDLAGAHAPLVNAPRPDFRNNLYCDYQDRGVWPAPDDYWEDEK